MDSHKCIVSGADSPTTGTLGDRNAEPRGVLQCGQSAVVGQLLGGDGFCPVKQESHSSEAGGPDT